MPQLTEGLQSGILSANILLAETAPQGSYYDVFASFWLSASVAATIEVQHRDSTNSNTIWSHRFNLSAAAPVTTPNPPTQFNLNTGERIRVLLISSIIGSVQASILT